MATTVNAKTIRAALGAAKAVGLDVGALANTWGLAEAMTDVDARFYIVSSGEQRIHAQGFASRRLNAEITERQRRQVGRLWPSVSEKLSPLASRVSGKSATRAQKSDHHRVIAPTT